MPKALKTCSKFNKLPNLVTLEGTKRSILVSEIVTSLKFDILSQTFFSLYSSKVAFVLTISRWTAVWPAVDVIKNSFEGNLDYPKLRNWKKFVMISEPSLQNENNAIFNQNYTLKQFINFKTAYSCCFSLGRNLDFPDFLQNKFYNIYYWWSNGFCNISHLQQWKIS